MLRRPEAGEEFRIAVAGRPVAGLGPTRRRPWLAGQVLARVWQTPAPRRLDADLEQLDAGLTDPSA